MKKIIKLNDGEIGASFQRSVTVHADPKSNKTWLEIPGLPADYQDSKMVQITAPTITNSNRFFIVADDHKGNSILAMVQGKMTSDSLKNAKKITDKRFIELAQSFINDMKKEVDHE